VANKAELASAFVKDRIAWISKPENESNTKAALAKLRRGIGKPPGSIPEIWELTLKGLPENLFSQGGIPTEAEWAVHIALTLYALHQQGKDPVYKSMNLKGKTLGQAVRGLVETQKDESRVKRRFDAAATSNDLTEFSYHLQGLVQLLKSKNIPMDYVQLTEDLYGFQRSEEDRDRIRLKWGRDYYRDGFRKENENEE